ncbi:hypothetical protein [Streptomyces sp. NPDC050485]|uniref:hypothetical protein n=1 Tax=Streptomyces sp. NPDC050485 TaxID=3365617 RepID=UPI0037A330F2
MASTPRPVFVTAGWGRGAGGRVVRDGAADIGTWLERACADDTLVTRIGPVHADHAEPGQVATSGRPMSSTRFD